MIGSLVKNQAGLDIRTPFQHRVPERRSHYSGGTGIITTSWCYGISHLSFLLARRAVQRCAFFFFLFLFLSLFNGGHCTQRGPKQPEGGAC
ncbi:hypothetical protein M433DRAFT_278081 [Acidomyces richmondensis BFW]|nr:MAG: hypothetical protein FE78DRAFT_431442 [Acidomyces sp. 'richmondensis']KYG44962.1 hypothetical protein M433DRAFT_278081 [Acidomyces richmondensis BFW]